MANKKQHKDIVPRGQHRGRGYGLTAPEREAIYQTYLALGENKSATARAHSLSRKTVDEVIAKFTEEHPAEELALRKEKMQDDIARRTSQVALQILDSIKPEDLETGRIPIYNSEGKLTGYTHFGPRIVEKATAFGIMQDKLKVQQDLQRAANADIDNGNLLLPNSIDDLRKAIMGRVKSLSIEINLSQEAPDLATRVDAAMLVPVEEVKPDDEPINFDNP